MKLTAAILAAALTATARAEVLSLNDDNYEELTAGKPVFIKFFAPWCGHCKAMASDWEKLSDDYAGSESALIAEVDCTAEDTEIVCDENAIEGFPTIKWGDTSGLEDYDGERDYDSLAAFAKENLKPMCSPANIDLCDADKKAAIERFQLMPVAELKAEIEKINTKIDEAEEMREDEIEKLQDAYEKFMAEYDEKVKNLKKESDFNLMKSVFTAKGGMKDRDEL
mmetsp:Transcript_27553/g.59877  ORF Transcript_27553/g.59877 Transcript_27553/m.59877 type:complete len:224 (-) Transcript_27553:381-1052(-)